MRLKKLKIHDEIARRVEVLNLLDSQKQSIGYVAKLMYEVVNGGGTIYVGGNGGNAATASHLVAELVGRYKINRVSIKAVSLTGDGAVTSAIANDFGYENVFTKQLEGQFQDGDIAIFLTTTGNSWSIINPIRAFKGRKTVLITGNDGGACKDEASAQIIIASDEQSIVQEAHLILIHILLDLLERKLQQEPDSRFLTVADAD